MAAACFMVINRLGDVAIVFQGRWTSNMCNRYMRPEIRVLPIAIDGYQFAWWPTRPYMSNSFCVHERCKTEPSLSTIVKLRNHVLEPIINRLL